MFITIMGILLLLAAGFGIGIYVLNRKISLTLHCEPYVYVVARAVGTVQADPASTEYARRFAEAIEAVVTDDETYHQVAQFVRRNTEMRARVSPGHARERREMLGAHATTLHEAVVALSHIIAARDPRIFYSRQSADSAKLKDKRKATRQKFFDWFDSMGGGPLDGHATV